jgi:hypothetical protein
MTHPEGTVAKRRVDVAFLQCFDATVFAESVMMTDAEGAPARPARLARRAPTSLGR